MPAFKFSKPNMIGLWALKGIVALLFLVTGAVKLMGAPMMVQEFERLGLGQGFRLFTGVVEVAGAVLLIVPRTSRFGAPLLLAVSVGALLAQGTRLHGDVVHTLVLIAITAVLTGLTWRATGAVAVPA